MKLIGLSGYARTGKDTVANILQDQHGFERVSFAAALKDIAEQINPIVYVFQDADYHRLKTELEYERGWEGAKGNPEVREFLQNLGKAVRDVIGEDTWVNAAFKGMDYSYDKRYVIPDMRFPNEHKAVTELGGLTVRIERPGYGPVNGHISETALDDEKFDWYFQNAGSLDDLEYLCEDLVKDVEGRL